MAQRKRQDQAGRIGQSRPTSCQVRASLPASRRDPPARAIGREGEPPGEPARRPAQAIRREGEPPGEPASGRGDLGRASLFCMPARREARPPEPENITGFVYQLRPSPSRNPRCGRTTGLRCGGSADTRGAAGPRGYGRGPGGRAGPGPARGPTPPPPPPCRRRIGSSARDARGLRHRWACAARPGRRTRRRRG